MALYHFHVDRISRSEGQTAVSAAAYRSGEKLHDYYYGEEPDYTRKGGVLLTEIILPEHVPEEYRDREKLWNAVEAAEKNPKAQLAYSFDFALQNELDFDENVRIAREFIRENFTSRGMICDVAFHEPDKDPDEIPNPHVHVLVPMRPMNPDGTFGSKQRREYFLDENGNRLRDEKGNYIFNAVRVNDWGDAETLMTWRENWAKAVNEAFEAKGITERVDHRSYVDQGLDLIPSVHEGPAVRAMEKKGIRTEKGEWNRLIRSLNRNIRKLLGKIKSIMNEIAELKEEEKAARMEAERRKEEYRSDLDEVMAALKEYTDTKKEKNAYYGGKAWAEAVSFINRYNICRLDDFEKVVGKLYDDVYDINRERKAAEAEIKSITETFRYQKQYKENAPIYRKWYEMKPGRKKDAFAESHRTEMLSTKEPQWIEVNNHALDYFGGVPALVVCDNCKQAVIVNQDWIEPELNKDYADWADHYGTVILPAKVRKPKFKSSVENAVGILEKGFFHKLEERQYFSLEQFNKDLWKELEALNKEPFKKKEHNRYYYWEEEKLELMPLPSMHYEYMERKTAKVSSDFHVRFDNAYYSVDKAYLHKKVSIKASSTIVRIYSLVGEFLCEWPRATRKGQWSTNPDHLPDSYKGFTQWNGPYFIQKAQLVGKNTETVIHTILKSRPYEVQTYRMCLGILNFTKKYSNKALEECCKQAIALNKQKYTFIKNTIPIVAGDLGEAGYRHSVPIKKEPARGGYVMPSEASSIDTLLSRSKALADQMREEADE